MTDIGLAPLEVPEPWPLATLWLIDGEGEVEGLEELAARARRGDRSALERVLEASYDLVLPVTRRITGSDSDGADAAQEALISVVRSIGRFDGRSRYSTWVYRIAVNAALDELRRRSRRPRPAEDWIGAVPPGRDVEDAAETVDVESALMALPVEFRAAVVLRDMCGLDYEEISAVLAIPAGTVRSRIARGRRALAELLSGARSDR